MSDEKTVWIIFRRYDSDGERKVTWRYNVKQRFSVTNPRLWKLVSQAKGKSTKLWNFRRNAENLREKIIIDDIRPPGRMTVTPVDDFHSASKNAFNHAISLIKNEPNRPCRVPVRPRLCRPNDQTDLQRNVHNKLFHILKRTHSSRKLPLSFTFHEIFTSSIRSQPQITVQSNPDITNPDLTNSWYNKGICIFRPA